MSFSPQNKLPINLKFFNKPELRIGFDGNIRKIKRVMNSCHVERTVKNEKKKILIRLTCIVTQRTLQIWKNKLL